MSHSLRPEFRPFRKPVNVRDASPACGRGSIGKTELTHLCAGFKFALFGLVLCLPLLLACHGDPAPPPVRPLQVKILVAAPRALRPELPLAGVLAPLPGKDVKVGALAAGRVDRVFVAEGDQVVAGQPLAHIEAQPYRNRVSETDAQREQSKAALENARARLTRTERLFTNGIASKQEVDDVRAAVVAAESAVKQAQAQGGTAEMQLDRATLRAPLSGVVAAILAFAGQPVDGSGTPVIEIADTRELDLRAPVPAARAGAVAVGEKAVLQVPGIGEVAGTVVAIAPLVDTATNTVLVRVRVPNESGRLRGGMVVRGALLLQERTGLAVPHGALLPGDGGAANTVAVLDSGNKKEENKIAHKSLTLGVSAGDWIEVLGGLSAGDRVIISGAYSLPDGTEVEVAQ